MKRSLPAEIENLKDGFSLALETLAWLAAWVLLPAWLAFRGSGISDFVGYALSAGSLLALGVAVDRGRAFQDLDHFLWFAGMTCLAILLFGGAVFGLGHLLLWIAL